MKFKKQTGPGIGAAISAIALATVMVGSGAPQQVSAQYPTYDPNAVRTAVLNMGMDSLSKVILTDPTSLGTYADLGTVAPVASTATVPNVVTPPASLVSFAAANKLTVQRAALLILGKALFWDEQVGSDGQACASCHFQAGADPRSDNVLNPGARDVYASEQTTFNAVASNPLAPAPGPNYQITTADFPFFQVADMTQSNYNDRVITFDTNDIIGSQGTYHATYAGSPAPNYSLPFAQGTYDTATARVLDPVYNVSGVNVRSVGPRQAAPAINAVFNFSNFWDGRANNSFNGVNPFGAMDITSTILRNSGGVLTADFAVTANSSLASQSVGPPNSQFSDEMAFNGRNMQDLGRKLLRLTGPGTGATATAVIDTLATSATFGQVLSITLTAPGSGYQGGATIVLSGGGGSGATATATVNAAGVLTGFTVTAPGAAYVTPPVVTIISNGLASATVPTTTPIIPLGAQMVSPTDSVLGSFVNPSNVNGGRGISLTYTELIQWAFVSAFWDSAGAADPVTGLPTTLVATNGCQLMEQNFPLFWGLAIQAYETTLRADQTPYDKFMSGNNGAFDPAGYTGTPGSSPSAQLALRGLLVYIHTESFTQQPDPQFNNLGTGACQLCHSGPELTEASLANVPLKGIVTTDMTVTTDHNRALAIVPSSSNFDVGFTNISVRPYWEDLGAGADIAGLGPLSKERAGELGLIYGVLALAPAAPNPTRGTNIDGAFKIPSIRNIDLTAPYYHNGSMLTLMQVSQFYERQGNFVDINENNTDVGQDMVFTNDADNEALVAFMLTLTDPRVTWEMAPFDHPQLFVPNGANTAVANPVLGAGYASDNYIVLPAVGAAGRQALGLGPLTNYLGVTNYPGEVLFARVTAGGTGYTTAPTVTLSAPPAVAANMPTTRQATAIAMVSGGAVTGVIITDAGAGYTTAPTVTFSGGGGTGAAATASIAPGEVTFISVSNGGSYTAGAQQTSLTITISAPPAGGTQATAVPVFTGTAVTSVRITNPGSGYTKAPTVTFSNSNGGAADAVAVANVLSPGGITHFTP